MLANQVESIGAEEKEKKGGRFWGSEGGAAREASARGRDRLGGEGRGPRSMSLPAHFAVRQIKEQGIQGNKKFQSGLLLGNPPRERTNSREKRVLQRVQPAKLGVAPPKLAGHRTDGADDRRPVSTKGRIVFRPRGRNSSGLISIYEARATRVGGLTRRIEPD